MLLKFIRDRIAARRLRKQRFEIALAFNRHYTFSGTRPLGGLWRCPSCSKIHQCASTSSISGRQFPSCCEFGFGHRLDKRHATGLSQ